MMPLVVALCRFRFAHVSGFLLLGWSSPADVAAQVTTSPAAVAQRDTRALDTFLPADAVSALQHRLASYDLTKTEVYTGQGGLEALRLLPDEKNPYAGRYPGTYGGEITCVLKVDGTTQNYLTAKFSGEETTSGRVLLVVNDLEIGSRHGGNEAYFEGMSGPVCTGAFYYRTVPLPRTLTDGKREVTVRLRSTGSYYAYGKPFDYPTYQRVMDKPSRGIYAVYTHTDPGVLPDAGPIVGQTPAYATSPARASVSLTELREQQLAQFDGKVKGMLKDDNRLPDHNAAWNALELLARAYYRPEIKAGYKNPAVIKKIGDIIDQLVRDDLAGRRKASGEWGGNYGRWGNAFAIAAGDFGKSFLDAKVDLGKGESPRREQWVRIFRESFEYGAANRRTITNQELFASLSVYGAAVALEKLEPGRHKKRVELAYHHALQSCGIEEFTGNAVIGPDGTPTLGDPKKAPTGPGCFFMTLKGTTHEPGWVSADCYGNLGNTLVELYDLTRLHLGAAGDKRVLATAVRHATIQTHFTYAWSAEGSPAQ